jgi:hypothetical protein
MELEVAKQLSNYAKSVSGARLPRQISYVQSKENHSGLFFLVSWGGVRLSPLFTSVTNWSILPAPDDR